MDIELFEFNGEIWNIEKVLEALSMHITPGDVLCIEVDTMRFGKLLPGVSRNQFLSNFFELFKELASPEGVIIIPSFSYSWGADSSEKIFDINNTPGKVGIFPEFMRVQPNVERTSDPMFSYLIFGNNAINIAKIAGKNTFGSNGIYRYLHENNAKLISFGLDGYDPTFIHYAEQYYHENVHKLDYRYIRSLMGKLLTLLEKDFKINSIVFLVSWIVMKDGNFTIRI